MGNLGNAVAVLHRPGVGRCQGNRRDGADQACHRAGLGGCDGAIAADANGVGVVVERLVDQDNLPGRFGGALLQFGEIGHHQHLGGDSFGRRANAVAQSEHRQRGPARLQHLGRFRPAHPMRHHGLLGMDIVQAVLFHFLENPIQRRFQIGRAALARAESVTQPGQPPISEIRISGGDNQTNCG